MKKYLLGAAILVASSTSAMAHVIVGDRVFPGTMAIDDPGVSDELVLPQVNYLNDAGEDNTHSYDTEFNFEYDKLITDKFAIEFDGGYDHQSNGGHDGFDNFGIGLKYQALTNAEHEAVISVGLDSDIGGTGSHLVGAESYTTFTPTIYVGKGFGDLPDSLDYLKPFAITGQFGYQIPSSAHGNDEAHPENLEYGFTVQYSLPYLQQHVKDLSIPAPISGLIPIIEFQFETPTARYGDDNVTTGTISPGFIWQGSSVQYGLEAVVPINSQSGHGIGVMAQAHFYLDDLFPGSSIGKPIW